MDSTSTGEARGGPASPAERAEVLLRRAWSRLGRAPVWWTEPLGPVAGWSGAWSPHLQWSGWSDPEVEYEGGALIIGPTSYLWGVEQLAVQGSDRKGERVRRLVGPRWLSCPTETYLQRRGRARSARDRLRDHAVGEYFHDRSAYQSWDGDGAVWVGSGDFDRALCRLDVSDETRPRITGYGDHSSGPLAAVVYGTSDDVRVGHGPVPDPQQRGVMSLDELADLVGGQATLDRPLVDVEPPDQDDDDDERTWTVSSSRAPQALNVKTGYAVEKRVRSHLRRNDPQLLPVIEFDSYAEEFLAFTPDETTARTLAGNLIQLVDDVTRRSADGAQTARN